MSSAGEGSDRGGEKAPNPIDYEQEVRNFRQEQGLAREVQENYKREALRKCNDLHRVLLDCYENKYFCGKEEKQFWDCYRRERGFKKSKVSQMAYKFYHKVSSQSDFTDNGEVESQEMKKDEE